MSDQKPAKRIKVSREGWKALREEKIGPCRVCAASAHTGNIELHHLLSRGQSGDDIADNLVPLCREHHRAVEANEVDARSRLRANLSQDEVDQIVRKKGWAWLDRRYPIPLTGDWPVLEEKQLSMETEPWWKDLEPVKIFNDELYEKVEGHEVEAVNPAQPTPGADCPTCHRRIPHPKKTKSPKSSVISYRVPDEAREDYKEVLEAAAKHAGIYDRPFWQFNILNAALVLALQEPNNFLSE